MSEPVRARHRPRCAVRCIGGARRGATLPLALFVLSALMLCAAGALDVSRLWAVRQQLQTTADASALAAADAFQRDVTASGAGARVAAAALAVANPVLGNTATIAAADVVPITWDDATRAATPATWGTATGVQVTSRVTAASLVAPFGVGSRTVVRRSTALVAGMSGTTCAFPLALPTAAFRRVVTGVAGVGAVTQPLLAALSTLPLATRTVIAVPAGAGTVPPLGTSWTAIDPSNGAGTTPQGLSDAIARVGCADHWVRVGEPRPTQPGAASDIAEVVAAAMNTACSIPPSPPPPPPAGVTVWFRMTLSGGWGGWDAALGAWNWVLGWGSGGLTIDWSGTAVGWSATFTLWSGTPTTPPPLTSAACTGTTPGVQGIVVRVPFADVAGATATPRHLAEFVVMCVFDRQTDRCGNAPSPDGPWLSPDPVNSYPDGTIVGYLRPLRSAPLDGGAGIEVGPVASNVQRLVLVQ